MTIEELFTELRAALAPWQGNVTVDVYHMAAGLDFGPAIPLSDWLLNNLTTGGVPAYLVEFRVQLNGHMVHRDRLQGFPGCCGIVVSTAAHTGSQWQNRGLNKIMNRYKIHLAKKMGYGILMCTDKFSNTYERKTLAANGWQDIYTFVNPRTTNKLAVSVISLT